MKKIFLFLIKIYQRILRPVMPSACVFEPSCSEYTKQAIEKYGAFKGSWMGARRISRCHPWQTQHFDPLE